jgi:excisionase family DNA binding protein
MAYLTKPQAAEMLQISVRTLEGLIKRGQLPAYKIGPQLVRLDEADIRAFVAARPVTPDRKEKTAPAGRICRYVPGQKVV